MSHPATNNDPPTTSTTSTASSSRSSISPKLPPNPPASSASSTTSTSSANKSTSTSTSTSMQGAPTTPLSHPHLAGVYWASRNPAIPTVAYQTICMSPAWAGMSMEELRLADYGAGWRFPK